MNYQLVIDSIFDRAKNRILPPEEKTHKHHIIMRSLGGGNSGENLVRLTIREHGLVHLLLTKINPCYKTYLAVFYMFNNGCIKNTREYEKIMIKVSEYQKEKCPMKGKKHSEETKEKIRNKAIGRKHSKEAKEKMRGRTAWNKNIPRTEIEKEHMRNALVGKHSGEKNGRYGKEVSEATRNKISIGNKGKVLTEETKQKMSDKHKGKVPWNSGLTKETSLLLRKISENKKGTVGPMTEKKHTEESKNKMSETRRKKGLGAKKGRKLSEETKIKISVSLKKTYRNKEILSNTREERK